MVGCQNVCENDGVCLNAQDLEDIRQKYQKTGN